MEKEILKIWMPISKSVDGKLVGILSDTSLDRDNEFMTKELLESWVKDKRPLPMLANHDNRMEKFVGGWTNKRLIKKGNKTAFLAEPFFFSKEANPLAYQIKNQVDEALAKGLDVGISIGAIDAEFIEKEIDGISRRGYSKAEIVEATIVPLQSNRGATFESIAKSFDLDLSKSKKVEECVEDLMNDPDFKPKDGKSKKESAWAVCNSKVGNKGIDNKIEKEDIKMSEEDTKPDEKDTGAEETEEEKTEEKKEEKKQEPKDDVSNEDAQDMVNENKKLKNRIIALEKKVAKLEKLPDLKGEVEGPNATQKTVNEEAGPTIEKMVGARYGVQK